MKCEPFISLQAPEADCLPISSSDTRQLPLLSGIDTAAKSYESESQRDGSPACTCTKEIFGCSIHPNTRGEWIASQRASLARTLATPAIAQVLRKVRAAASGPKSSALLASFDPVTCSLKTSQQSLFSDSTPCSPILPSWGLMQGGAVYELPMLERATSESDGLLLPTLVRRDYRHPGRSRMERTGGTHGECLPQVIGGPLNPAWTEWFMGLPVGWTASSAKAMCKSRRKQRSRGES